MLLRWSNRLTLWASENMRRAARFRRYIAALQVALSLILLGAFWAAFNSARRARHLNSWVTHTQRVAATLSSARSDWLRLQMYAWTHLSTGYTAIREQFETDSTDLEDNLKELQVLTADNPQQQMLLAQLRPLLKSQLGEFRASLVKNGAGNTKVPENATWLSAAFASRKLFDEMEANESALLASRNFATESNTRQTEAVLVLATALTLSMLTAGGYLIQREILARAKIEVGLRQAQELLGVKYEEQRGELDHAIQDLHGQILQRKLAEAEVRRLNAGLEERVQTRTSELREANRELEAFTYSVSHDLRAPLRHMDAFSRMLQQQHGPGLSTEGKRLLERIREASTRMALLVEDLLQLSRLSRKLPNFKNVCLDEIVQEVRREVDEGDKEREIRWHIATMPSVQGDGVLLRQVFVNLLANAAKFTRLQTAATIEVGSRHEEKELVIFVRDNGAGFDPRYADKLFGVFQRLHRQEEFEGTGIGLATVQRIVRKHGGRVWAESEPGRGATFYFSLPLASGEPAEVPQWIGAAT